MPVKRQRSWCRPDVCGIGVIETSFALTQVFLRFPETPDLTAIVIAVANPVTAIANRVDRGPHRGLDHPPIKLDHWLGRVEDPVTLPADGNRRCACNNRSTHGNTYAMEPCSHPGLMKGGSISRLRYFRCCCCAQRVCKQSRRSGDSGLQYSPWWCIRTLSP